MKKIRQNWNSFPDKFGKGTKFFKILHELHDLNVRGNCEIVTIVFQENCSNHNK